LGRIEERGLSVPSSTTRNLFLVGRDRYRGKDGDDRHHDHQFDQCEAAC
jgi:hypothetical protein